MARIDISQFKGIMPKLSNDKLPLEMCQELVNGNTESGSLLPYKNPISETALSELSYKSLFEYIYSSTNNWVYYDGVVYCSRSHVANDDFERLYYMGESGLPAKGTLTLDVNPVAVDADTMTIDASVYTFVAAAAAPLDIQIGSELEETKRNIIYALRGQDSYNTTPHATVQPYEWDGDELILYATSHGTAGNAIVTTETFTAVTNVFDAATLGTTQAGVDDGTYRAHANDIDSTPWDFLTDYYFPGHVAGAAPTIVPQTPGATYLAYYYTYVSRYGEESAGSAITEITNQTVDARVHVDALTAPTANHGMETVGTNVPSVRIYRTSVDGTGGAEFLLVCEATYFSATATYVQGDFVIYDTDLWECTNAGGHGPAAWNAANFTQGEAVTVAELALSTTGDSYSWRPAPDDLTNLRSHPNGFFVASKNNEIHFSEPFYHHAWPEDYIIHLDSTIVGIGIFGSTIVVLTDGWVYTFSGPHPDSLYKQRLAYQPCLSQRGVVEISGGVMFPSSEGFYIVSSGGIQNVTGDIFKPDDLADYHLETMHGAWYNKSYYGFYNDGTDSGFIRIDLKNNAVTTGNTYHHATYITLSDGIFRTITASNLSAPTILYIARWQYNQTSYKNYLFKSRRYTVERPLNFKVAVIQMDYDFYDNVQLLIGEDTPLADLNQAEWDIETDEHPQGVLYACVNDWEPNFHEVNGDRLYNLASLGVQNFITFRIYVDSVLKFSTQVYDNKSFKLPRGFKGKDWEFEAIGMIPIKRIVVATSTEELRLNG